MDRLLKLDRGLVSRWIFSNENITVLETKNADGESALAVNLLGPLKVTRVFIKPNA